MENTFTREVYGSSFTHTARDWFARSAPDEWIPPEVAEQIIAEMDEQMGLGTFDQGDWQAKFDGFTQEVCSRMGLDEDGIDEDGNAWNPEMMARPEVLDCDRETELLSLPEPFEMLSDLERGALDDNPYFDNPFDD